MPFTPFHLGPGAAIKAVIPKHFSFTVFGFSQVVTDCETAYYLLHGQYPCHRFFHTFLGATLVAIFSLFVGRMVCQYALRLWASWPAAPFARHFRHGTIIDLRSAATGAFIGTYSHVVLDGIMHADMRPFMPFSSANPFFGLVSFLTLHISCLILALFGVIRIAVANRKA